MKTIYLSGKITGDKFYAEKFLRIEQQLKKDTGCRIINPIHVLPWMGVKRWFFYMVPAIKNVYRANAVYLLPDWNQSKGAIIEFLAAWVMRKAIYYIQVRPAKLSRETKTRYIIMRRTPFSRHQSVSKVIPKYIKR